MARFHCGISIDGISLKTLIYGIEDFVTASRPLDNAQIQLGLELRLFLFD
jgi:hypothetical protein